MLSIPSLTRVLLALLRRPPPPLRARLHTPPLLLLHLATLPTHCPAPAQRWTYVYYSGGAAEIRK
jgi:hypothetical protein